MKKLLLTLAVFCLPVTPVLADSIVSVGNYTWNVVTQRTETITVNVSNVPSFPADLVNGAFVGFSVGDGGPSNPLTPGTELVQITGFSYGSIWSGPSQAIDTGASGPVIPLGGAVLGVNAALTSASTPTAANGTLLTFTLQGPNPSDPLQGLESEIGHSLLLDSDFGQFTDLANGSSYLNVTFVTGHLTLTPEPSMGIMLLTLGGALFGWRCFRSKKSRRS